MNGTRGLSIGTSFRPEWRPEDLPRVASEVQELGYDELWVVEDCFFAGGLTLAAVALAVTEELRIGIGLLPAAVRNSAILAMELAGLARLYPGRLSVALGHGVERWMVQIGARPRNRIVVLEETVAAVSALLAGAHRTITGDHVQLDDVALAHPPLSPPELLVGTTGRRGLEVAGRLASGILLPQGATSDAVRWVRAITTAVDPRTRTVMYAWVMIDDDGRRARASLRPELDRWLTVERYPELARRVPAGLPSDDWLKYMAIAGTPVECAAAVMRWADAGADSVVLRPPVEDGMDQVRRFAGEVMPLLTPPRPRR